MKKIALLHTVKSVLMTFEDRLRNAMPGEELLINNTLDEFLASDPNLKGRFTCENSNRLFLLLKALELEEPDVIVVTCSTLTPGVAKIREYIKPPVIAIDDAMTLKAAGIGGRVMIMATAHSTVEPTREKLLHDAQAVGKPIEISTLVCGDAYTAIKRLDNETHDRLLKEAALSIKQQDVVVLAQASMAHLDEDIQKICGCTVLSSPSLCVSQVKDLLLQKDA